MAQKKVLIFSPFGSWRVHGQLELIAGLALHVRGAEVRIIGCDGLFRERCYVLAHSNNPQHDCGLCSQTGKDFFGASGLPYEQLRTYLTAEDFAEADAIRHATFPENPFRWVHDGVPLGEVVSRSVSSLLRANPRMYRLPHVQEAYRVYARDAVLCRRGLERVLDSFKPDQLIIFNGYGNLHGTALYLAKQRGIEIVTHDKGMSENTFIVNDNCPSGDIPKQCAIAKRWKDVPLKSEELTRVHEFFAGRRVGRGMNYQLFYNFENSLEDVAKQLRLPPGVRTFGFFSASEYELPFYEACPALARQLDFLDYLFEIFKDRDDYLVVRHHPIIAGVQSNNPDWDLMTRIYDQALRAPKNVRIILPHEKLNTYAILPFLSGCLIPGSTVSMEAVAMGIPTASLSGGLPADGATEQFHDITKIELEAVVDRLFKHYDSFGVDDYRRLYRFINAVFYRHPKTFSSFAIKNFHEADIRVTSLEQLSAGHDPELDRVCDHILHRTDLYPSPTSQDFTLPTSTEETFFSAWNTEVRALHAKALKLDGRGSEPKVAIVRVFLNGAGPNAHARNEERQRHRTMQTIDWDASAPSAAFELQSILSAADFDFVAFEFPGVIWDECHISGAIAQLEEQPTHSAIMRGWWVYGDSKILERRLIEKDTLRGGILNVAPFGKDLSGFVSLVMRRTGLIPLLSTMLRPQLQATEITDAIFAMPLLFDTMATVVVRPPEVAEVKSNNAEVAKPTSVSMGVSRRVLNPGATPTEMIAATWALPRDLVSDGYDQALEILSSQIPIKVHEYASGTECWTWKVPMKWRCKAGFIETLAGKKICDYQQNPLHIPSYAHSIDATVSRAELLTHIGVHPKLPHAIPYTYFFYKEGWGFNTSEIVRESLQDDRYRVHIESEATPGTLKVGEIFLPGDSEECLVLCAHLDHPMQVNDGLSGVVVGIDVMRELEKRRQRRFSYRLLIVSETIGSVAYLSHNEHLIPSMRGGIFLEMLGLPYQHTLQHSYLGNAPFDVAALAALSQAEEPYRVGKFLEVVTNDDRQFNAPGVRVPMLSLSRVETPCGKNNAWVFPEYHSHLDSPALCSAENLRASRDLILSILETYEADAVPTNHFKGEVFLSRYGITYDYAIDPKYGQALFEFMHAIDGNASLAAIALKHGLSIRTVHHIAKQFESHGLISMRSH